MKANGLILFLALDWAKALDSVSPSNLCLALERFGLPTEIISMIRHIYSNRTFIIRDGGTSSAIHTQHFGISQGCPYC